MVYRELPKSKYNRFFKLLHEMWPDAHCELIHNNDFQLLIAVVLSAQATDISVNKALVPLLKENPSFSPEDLLKMGQEGFLKVIRSIGLAPTKSKNCYHLARMLVERFSGQVPRNRKDLESLPGVGRKTANVVLNVLCGVPTMPVDTHVDRISQRTGIAPETANRLLIEEEILKKVPKQYAQNAHHQLIFHGRYHCKARKPQCDSCALEELCPKNGL